MLHSQLGQTFKKMNAEAARNRSTFYRAFWHMMNACMAQIRNVRAGAQYIFNFSNFGWGNFDPKMEKQMSNLYQDGYPMKMSLALLVDSPWYIKMVLNVCRLFLKKKLMDRIKPCKRNSKIVSHFEDLLPPALKGECEYDLVGWMKERIAVRAETNAKLEKLIQYVPEMNSEEEPEELD